MNSKNLSKAINRMLAFLLSVAMIATSSFVTPALADVVDDEVIEVVNEIGSEAASDTVMTTDDSTDIIVENIEEGGEEASDGQAAGADMPKQLSKSQITLIDDTVQTQTYKADDYVLNDFASASNANILVTDENGNPLSASDVTITSKLQEKKSDGAWGDATDNKIKKAGSYQLVVTVAPGAEPGGKLYEGSNEFPITIKPLDLKDAVVVDDGSTKTKLAADNLVITWKQSKSTDGTKLTADLADSSNATKGCKYTISDSDKNKGTVLSVNENSIDDIGFDEGIASATNKTKVAEELGAMTADLIADKKISYAVKPGDGGNNLTNATTTDDDTKKPYIEITWNDKDFPNYTGSIKVPFDIAVKAASSTLEKNEYNQNVTVTIDEENIYDKVNLEEIVYTQVGAGTGYLKPDNVVLGSVSSGFNDFFTVDDTHFEGDTDVDLKIEKVNGVYYLFYSVNGTPNASTGKIPALETKTKAVPVTYTFNNYSGPLSLNITFNALKKNAKTTKFQFVDADDDKMEKLEYSYSEANPTIKVKVTDANVNTSDNSLTAYYYDKDGKFIEKKAGKVTESGTPVNLTPTGTNLANVGTYSVKVVYVSAHASDQITESIGPETITVKPADGKLDDISGTESLKAQYGKKFANTDITVKANGFSGALELDKDYTLTYVNNNTVTKLWNSAHSNGEATPCDVCKLITTIKAAHKSDTALQAVDYAGAEAFFEGHYTDEFYEMDTTVTPNVPLKAYKIDVASVAGEILIHKGRPYAVITGKGNFSDKTTANIVFDVVTNATPLDVDTRVKTQVIKSVTGKVTIDLDKLYHKGTRGATGYEAIIPAKGYAENATIAASTDTEKTVVTSAKVVKRADGGYDLEFTPNANILAEAGRKLVFAVTPDFGGMYTANGGSTTDITLNIKDEVVLSTDAKEAYTYSGSNIVITPSVKKKGETAEYDTVSSSFETAEYYQLATELNPNYKAPADLTTITTPLKVIGGEVYSSAAWNSSTSTWTGGNLDAAAVSKAGANTPNHYAQVFKLKSAITNKASTYSDAEEIVAAYTVSKYDITSSTTKIDWGDAAFAEANQSGIEYLTPAYTNLKTISNLSFISVRRTDLQNLNLKTYLEVKSITPVAGEKTASKGLYDLKVVLGPTNTAVTNGFIEGKTLEHTYKAIITPHKVGVSGDTTSEITSLYIPAGGYKFDGEAKTPGINQIKIKNYNDNGAFSIRTFPDEYYDVEYSKNVDAYTATGGDDKSEDACRAIIKFKGLYTGSIAKSFTIAASDKQLDIPEFEYKIFTKTTSIVLPTDLGEGIVATSAFDNPVKVANSGQLDLTIGENAITNGVLSFTKPGDSNAGYDAIYTVDVTVKNYGTQKVKLHIYVVSDSLKATITLTAGSTKAYDGEPLAITAYTAEQAVGSKDVTGQLDELQYYDMSGTTPELLKKAPVNVGSYRVIGQLKKTSTLVAEPKVVDYKITQKDITALTNEIKIEIDKKYKDAAADTYNIDYAGLANDLVLPYTKILANVGTDSGPVWEEIAEDYDFNLDWKQNSSDPGTPESATGKAGAKTLTISPAESANIKFTAKVLTVNVKKIRILINLEDLPNYIIGSTATITGKPSVGISTGATDLDRIRATIIGGIEGDVVTAGTVSQVGKDGTTAISQSNPFQSATDGPYYYKLTGVTTILDKTGIDVTDNYDLTSVNTDTDKYTYVGKMARLVVIDPTNIPEEQSKDYLVTYRDGLGNEMAVESYAAGTLIDINSTPDADATWYTDIALTKQWDFAKDIVDGNKTLYASIRTNIKTGTSDVIEPVGSTEKYVEDADWIRSLEIEAIPDQVYTGSAIKPTVNVKLNGQLLKKSTDYTVTYNSKAIAVTKREETGAKPGYFCTVKLKNVKVDAKTQAEFKVYYDIVPASIGNAVITYADQVEKDKSAKPLSGVKVGKRALKMGTDFTYGVKAPGADSFVEVTGNKINNTTFSKAGVYQVRIKAVSESNYEGSKIVNVSVKDKAHLLKNATIKLDKTTVDVVENSDGTAASTKIGATITIDKVKYYYNPSVGAFTNEKGASKEQVDYANDNLNVTYANDAIGATKAATVTVTPKTSEFEGYKSAKYTVRCTKKISAAILKDTIKKVIKDSAKKNQIVFDGNAWTMDRVLMAVGHEDSFDVDMIDDIAIADKTAWRYGETYYISYAKNVDAGTATMTFKAAPGSIYTGSFKITFKIQKGSINTDGLVAFGASVNDANKKYTGEVYRNSASAVKMITTNGLLVNENTGNPLIEGKDFTISYKNNNAKKSKVGEATIKGKGNYTGSTVITFDIPDGI